MNEFQSRLVPVLCLACAALAGCGSDDAAEKKQAEVLAPDAEHYGKSYSDWNADWFRWNYSIPVDADCNLPVDDSTGEFCALGQPDDMFFLAGVFTEAGSEYVVLRDQCEVPADKPIFFPIFNTAADNGGVPPEEQFTPEDNAAYVSEKLDAVDPSTLFASVDGVAVPDLENFRTDVTQFSYDVPDEPNVYTCAGVPGVTGTIDPSFAGGYYVMLAPLEPGKHDINFGFNHGTDDISMDITYKLTVR